MTDKKILIVISLFFFATSCNVLKQANEMKTFGKCDFRLKNIEDVTLAGVDITEVDQLSDLSFPEASNITMTAMQGKLPLYFQLNVEVRNPNDRKASMNRFLWDLFIDDQLITSGKVTKDISVEPDGGISVMPIQVGVDLFEVLNGKNADAIINFAMNLSGSGTSPTRIKLRAKPTVYVGTTMVDYPGWINIEQEFVSE